ncbi:MAG: chromate efflux transporter [Xanthobacteraceae bacterium]|nr:chromate efflux transporter [Xanthobacteraceae bacterium]QYK44830.1 MAG: chromate efflux transporter [Xanthobacteraceae bacterium]
MQRAEAPAHPTFAEATRVWLKIALLSFGGPAAQIALMHRVLVDEKRWISDSRFLHALNYCMLLPGPEAQQLATYVGWLLHKTRGGLVAGLLFILPGVASIMALSWIYVLFGKVGFVAAIFFGLKAAILAVVLEAVVRIGKRALKNPSLVSLAGGAFIAIYFLKVPFPVVVLGAGLIGYLGSKLGAPGFDVNVLHGPSKSDAVVDALLDQQQPEHTKPSLLRFIRVSLTWLAIWLVPVAALLLALGEAHVFSRIAVFFSQMAMVTFGGAYAVLAYVAQQAVDNYAWLSAGEMLDGLGLAETTPGPLIMVLQFVGFLAGFRDPGMMHPLLAATLGGLLATWVTFAPCFLWIFAGAPYVETMRANRALAAALAAITAAVVGVILNLALWFAVHTIFAQTRDIAFGPVSFDAPVFASINPWAALLAAAAIVAMFLFKARMIPVLVACAFAGIALHLLGFV